MQKIRVERRINDIHKDKKHIVLELKRTEIFSFQKHNKYLLRLVNMI